MTASWWITLMVCVASLVYACFEHAEIFDKFKTAVRGDRLKNGSKLFLLWFVPVASLVATLWGAWEIVESEQSAKRQVQGIVDTTDRLAKDLEGVWIRSRPRIVQFDSGQFIKDLKDKPKGIVELLVISNDQEASLFAGFLADSIITAGWTVAATNPITAEQATRIGAWPQSGGIMLIKPATNPN